MFEMLIPLIKDLGSDISPGRMLESIVLLFIIWSKLKPHLKKIEDRLEGLEKAVNCKFGLSEERILKVETRLDVIEKIKLGGCDEKISFI